MVFSPVTLGRLELKNRLVVAPMTTYSSLPDGQISPDEIPYLRRRAEGGFGLVMTAACCIHPSGWAFDGQWQCSSDEYLPSLRAVADAIHEGGSRACLQIHHGGRAAPSRLCGGSVSASAISAERPGAEVPRELTEAEIEEIIAAFGSAARRAVEAGFEAIEIHGANTYLLQQFVSPHSNRRTDQWGQDRLLFVRRVVEAVLEAAPDACVGYRFSSEEAEEPGIRWENTAALIDVLCAYDLDFLHVSLWDFQMMGLAADWPETTLERVAKHIDGRKPLIGVGKVWTREDAEAVLDLGADLVAVGRAALANPEWPQLIENSGEVRRKLNRATFEQDQTFPAGLAEKARTVPNWFEFED